MAPSRLSRSTRHRSRSGAADNWWRSTWYFGATMAICLLVLVGAASTALAQSVDGLRVTSSTTYTPDPAQERIDVTSTYTMTNVKPAETLGGTVRSFYFTSWVIAMPASVSGFAASSSGTPLRTSIEAAPDAPDVVFGTISLPFNLNYDQSVTLDVRYTIPGGDPRAEDVVARVNDSFLSFSVWAAGDPGRTDVRIVVPDGFSMDLQGDLGDLREVTIDGQTVLEAVSIADPQAFFGQVFGRNDAGLLIGTAELPDAVATVRAWPDDPEWAAFVVGAIEDDVPVIAELTGLDWPAGDIEVIETVTPYLFGYGGWFNASSGVIEVGEYLERDLILHELGHAWFNDTLIDGRWITEGLAEEYASRVIHATGGELLDPEQPDLSDPIRVPLAEWASPWTLDEEDAFAYEQYHYNASWWVIRQITDQIGLDAFSSVLVALQEDTLPYVVDGQVDQTVLATQWIHLYDLLETQAGAAGLEELFRTYVLSAPDQTLLSQRAGALAAYNELTLAGNRITAPIVHRWAPPLVVRREMAAWRFTKAEARIADARAVLDVRDQVLELGQELRLQVEHSAEATYENATSRNDLIQARVEAQALLSAVQELNTQRQDLVDQAEALHTTLVFPPMTYDEAQNDISGQQQAITTLADLRAHVETSAGELSLEPPAWPASDGFTDFGAATSLAQARLATLDAIDSAGATVQARQNIRQRFGLWRSDVDGELERARRAFEADDLADAIEASARAEVMIANAASTGSARLTWAALSGLAVLLVGGGTVWSRRRVTHRSSGRSAKSAGEESA